MKQARVYFWAQAGCLDPSGITSIWIYAIPSDQIDEYLLDANDGFNRLPRCARRLEHSTTGRDT